MYFSIIVPMYNVEKYIKNCISSILQQKEGLYELILVDDGSTDHTVEIVKKIIKNNKWSSLITQKNKGPSAARNQGIRLAKGKWIMFVDADDWLQKDALITIEKYVSDDEFDMISFDYYKGKKVISNNCNKVLTNREFSEILLYPKYHFGLVWSNVYSAELLKKNEVYFNENLLYSEDCEFIIKLCKYIGKVYIINKPLYYYRTYNESLSRAYKEIILEKYLNAIHIIKHEIIDMQNYNEMKKMFFAYVRLIIIFIVLNSIFHPDNTKSLSEKKKILNKLLSEKVVQEAMEGNIYQEFGVAKCCTLFCIKHRLNIFLIIIAILNNRRR